MANIYKFTPERYAEVDAELECIAQYLVALAGEIQAIAAPSNKEGHNWLQANIAQQRVATLRQALAESLRR